MTPIDRLFQAWVTRRRFIQILGIGAGSAAAGCATNPVTGKSQLMLISENQEIELDRRNSPHQFSADYGISQDKRLNAYIEQVGRALSRVTHRPQMPYSFQVVNATYINAYAFPGGSIAATRGILLRLDNEAELAALLGHELGHVNARHTAEIMSKQMLASMAVGLAAAYLGTRGTGYGDLAAQLGMLGSGALLAHYSRDNERQADELGMRYMVAAGYSAEGMVGLMEMLLGLSRHKVSATELLFATHPMSSERYQTAVARAEEQYASDRKKPVYRQRYMDHTASLRRMAPAIEAMQEAGAEMGKERFDQAEALLKKALAQAPDDYAGLLMMAKCQLMKKRYDAAAEYVERARAVYPGEAQAVYLSGYLNLNRKNYPAALSDFEQYDRLLPGNPNPLFFRGLCYEKMGNRPRAADAYARYLQVVRQGRQAEYAYSRLVQWGYIRQRRR